MGYSLAGVDNPHMVLLTGLHGFSMVESMGLCSSQMSAAKRTQTMFGVLPLYRS